MLRIPMSIPHSEDKRYEESRKHALDLKVLGVGSRSGLNELDYALVHYRQDAPHAPLQAELLQVGSTTI